MRAKREIGPFARRRVNVTPSIVTGYGPQAGSAPCISLSLVHATGAQTQGGPARGHLTFQMLQGRSAGALPASHSGAVRHPFPDGHRATAFAADGGAITVSIPVLAPVPLAIAIRLTDPHAHAGTLDATALRGRGGGRNGSGQDGSGSNGQQCCAHIPLL